MPTTARVTATLMDYPVAKIVVRRDKITDLKTRAGFTTDDQLARAVGVHPTQFSRVLSGRSEPGNKFIAGMLEVFGVAAFPEVFAVVSDDEGSDA
jgi:transcriptional regulator with XRE-family HTH domain